jgi:hypothetical protein
VPSENDQVVADTCGIFVSASKGEDGPGRGQQNKPFKTIAAAIDAAVIAKKPVYACGEPFKEAVTISAPVTLYGALDCAKGWVYSTAKKTAISTDPDAIPMVLAGSASGSSVHDFTITAADAMMAGGSSIALIVDHADLTLDAVVLVAGAAKAGAAGAAQDQVPTPGGAKGGNGADNMCGGANNIGGSAGQSECLHMGNMVDVSAGLGGNGTNGLTGGSGQDGNPLGATGKGGKAQDANGSCDPGGKGADGAPGLPGEGGRGAGDIDLTGYHATTATGGQGESTPGQGGGGGGGARKCGNGGSGPGGGGGGAGGCGGLSGNAGQSGGSSIAILALSAKLTLYKVQITTHDGGKGGVGGDGQPGAAGGQPGNAGGANACNGGKGGQGGRGGSGGGGAGGHSIGIALKGGPVPVLTTTTIKTGAGASGGTGGDLDMTPQTKGDDGLVCKTLDFTSPADPLACAK